MWHGFALRLALLGGRPADPHRSPQILEPYGVTLTWMCKPTACPFTVQDNFAQRESQLANRPPMVATMSVQRERPMAVKLYKVCSGAPVGM